MRQGCPLAPMLILFPGTGPAHHHLPLPLQRPPSSLANFIPFGCMQTHLCSLWDISMSLPDLGSTLSLLQACGGQGRTAQSQQCYQAWKSRAGQGHWKGKRRQSCSEPLVSFGCLSPSCTYVDGFLVWGRLMPGSWVALTDCSVQKARQRANSLY